MKVSIFASSSVFVGFVVGFVVGSIAFGCDPIVVDERTDISDGGVDANDGGEVDAEPSQLPVGSACDVSSQCESDCCIPSKSTLFGVCFDASYVGCIEVAEPHPFKSSCAGDSFLYTCGDAYDSSKLVAECAFVGAGKLFEFYYCCPTKL